MNSSMMQLMFTSCTTNAALNFAYGVVISPLGNAAPARRSVDTV